MEPLLGVAAVWGIYGWIYFRHSSNTIQTGSSRRSISDSALEDVQSAKKDHRLRSFEIISLHVPPPQVGDRGRAGHGFTVTATEDVTVAGAVGVAKPDGSVTEMVVEPVALGVKTPEVFVLVPTGIVRDEGKVPTAGLVFPKFTVRVDATF